MVDDISFCWPEEIDIIIIIAAIVEIHRHLCRDRLTHLYISLH